MPIRPSPLPRPAAALVLAGISLVAAAAVGSLFLDTARDAWVAVAASGPAGPADGILLVVGLGGALLSLWLGLGMALSALSALPGAVGHVCRELADRVAPAAVRKVVAFVLGTTLTAALVPGTALAGISQGAVRPDVVASARHVRGDLAAAAPDASFHVVDGLPPVTHLDVYARDAKAPDAAPPPAWSLVRPVRSGEDVVVLRGDTLWSIAAHHLGAGAGSAEIDTQWRRWHATNRQVIGEDANLILPGQVLRPPPSPSPQAGS